MDEQLQFVMLIISRLDSIKVPYMLTGSMAMAFYSSPRMTRDVDLVVELNRLAVDRLVELFAGDCYIETESVRQAVETHSMFNVIHREWALKADFVVRKASEYRAVEFARRQLLEFEGNEVWVVAVEDLILSKLVWSKTSHSALQSRDVRQLLSSEIALDREYLRKWAQALKVERLLEEAMRDV